MSGLSGLPKFKTVLTLAFVVLVCTFYWDLFILRRLYSPRHSHRQAKRVNRPVGWSWECVKGAGEEMCRRVAPDPHSSSSMSLSTCTKTCLPGRYLWPLPTGQVRIRNTTASFHPHHLRVNFAPVDDAELSNLLKKKAKLYVEKISNLSEKSHAHTTVSVFAVTINVNKKTRDLKYKLNIDESYKLTVSQKGTKVEAVIKSATFLGAHHGLETLGQLIWWDERQRALRILNSAVITDAPLFTYRGLLLDTANTFIPVTSILRSVDAMSMNKMNVFHWHLTDSKSFPFASDKFPLFKKFGPYSSKEVYSVGDIKRVVEYAEVRGVTVLVEVDAPAHQGQGWEWGGREGRGNLSLCLHAEPFSEFCIEPPCGQLNPVNDDSYWVLVQVLKELDGITKPGNLMHVGGDDIDFRCWASFGEVTDTEVYMAKGVVGVWELFYETFFSKLLDEKILPKNVILWSNELIDASDLWHQLKHTSIIVQSRGPSTSGELETLVKSKLRVIVSSSDVWSLSDPQTWTAVYSHRPWADLALAERTSVIGGEALAWTEQLDHHALDPRLWPAAAAVAERLWTDPAPGAAPGDRLAWHRERMVQAGISCSPVTPKWCLQNPYQCL